MVTKDIELKIDNLRYALDDVDLLMRRARKEWFEKGNYISVLRIHTFCIRIFDLIEALDNLTEIEKNIIGGIKL